MLIAVGPSRYFNTGMEFDVCELKTVPTPYVVLRNVHVYVASTSYEDRVDIRSTGVLHPGHLESVLDRETHRRTQKAFPCHGDNVILYNMNVFM